MPIASRTIRIVSSASARALRLPSAMTSSTRPGFASNVGAALADRREERLERGDQLPLDLDVADLAGPVPLLQVVDLGGVGVEGVVVLEDRVALDVAGVGGPEAGRVGVHAAHLPLDLLGRVGEHDGVVEALAHLRLAVDADQGRDVADQRVGDGKHLAVEVVEAAGDLAGDFQVGRLVLADRDEVAAHDQDVGRLEDRVAEQAVRGGLELEVADDVFEGGSALEPGHRDQHAEQQVQLAGLGDERLEVDRAALGVDADAEVVEDELADVLADVARVLEAGGQGVVVGDDEEAVVLVLEPDAVRQRADVVAEVELARSVGRR